MANQEATQQKFIAAILSLTLYLYVKQIQNKKMDKQQYFIMWRSLSQKLRTYKILKTYVKYFQYILNQQRCNRKIEIEGQFQRIIWGNLQCSSKQIQKTMLLKKDIIILSITQDYFICDAILYSLMKQDQDIKWQIQVLVTQKNSKMCISTPRQKEIQIHGQQVWGIYLHLKQLLGQQAQIFLRTFYLNWQSCEDNIKMIVFLLFSITLSGIHKIKKQKLFMNLLINYSCQYVLQKPNPQKNIGIKSREIN
ncbi:unnamed protein product [Paramecium octaurelia]|uniref:Uncharacterized protein n=1 Tax=Paramecium octaurelia TaxID=43137 RepID=A0A8S1VCX9_PAROT|nr:unnamed protein product [Paramecium octaurelia]